MSEYPCPFFSLYTCWRKRGVRALCVFAVLFFFGSPALKAEEAWYPAEVDVWQPPFNEMRKREKKQYMPLDKARKKWRIRVFIPHLKDAYWLGVNYGLIDEARRLGVSLSVYEASSRFNASKSRIASPRNRMVSSSAPFRLTGSTTSSRKPMNKESRCSI